MVGGGGCGWDSGGFDVSWVGCDTGLVGLRRDDGRACCVIDADLESRDWMDIVCCSSLNASWMEGNDCILADGADSFSWSDACLVSGGEIYPLFPLLIPITELAADDG